MSLNVSSSGGGDFELVPAGAYIARCYRILDLGTQTTVGQYGAKTQKKVMVSWELLDDTVKMEDGRPFAVHKNYTASLSEKANLRQDLEAWRNKKFDATELESFDLKNVLGAYCQIQVVHSEDGKFANVQTIMSYKGEKPAGVNALISFDIDEPDMKVFDSLSDNMKKKIESAPEWGMPSAKPAPSPAAKTKPEEVTITEAKPEEVTPELRKALDERDEFGNEPINLDDIPF